MKTTLVSTPFPLEGEEGKDNAEEEQHTEDVACMSTVEKKMQFYFCKVSENQQDLLGWGSERHFMFYSKVSFGKVSFEYVLQKLQRTVAISLH